MALTDTMRYVNPETGAVTTSTAVGSPAIKLDYSGTNLGAADLTEMVLSSGTAYSYPVVGLTKNYFDGGPFVPHGALEGKEAVLAADADASATALTIEQALTPDDRPILEAGVPYVLMNRRPKFGETVWGNTEINPEVVTIDASYSYSGSTGTNDGTVPTVSAITSARKRGAILQRVTPYPVSYDAEKGTFGVRYELEQPSELTITAVADGGSQTINVSFNETTDAVVQAYMVQILKKGDDLCLYSEPTSCPEYVLESQYSDGSDQQNAIFTLDSSLLSETSGVITISGLNRYFDSESHTVATIVAGTYYVAVRALNQTVKDTDLRMSDATFSSVTVA